MEPQVIKNHTRALGAPRDWNPATDGLCGTLPIRDENHSPGVGRMVSAWRPTSDELAALNRGAQVMLSVIGHVHPPVALYVEEEA